jgi:hypothetical protein
MTILRIDRPSPGQVVEIQPRPMPAAEMPAAEARPEADPLDAMMMLADAAAMVKVTCRGLLKFLIPFSLCHRV